MVAVGKVSSQPVQAPRRVYAGLELPGKRGLRHHEAGSISNSYHMLRDFGQSVCRVFMYIILEISVFNVFSNFILHLLVISFGRFFIITRLISILH